ncbi:hypothetical protein [Saccharothrix coeruleofusca]|uniref:Uncharacterized protein n=1 Tax=Saccharothrix coeruleofusca TaxID=33919 RepID=A0A918APS7_9PSEU|nr:hypothetical protein [Saccharothrix coeruleofusca]MBP2334896.1 hypothetical protein [Saccharothrix coeruleofusca]GGP67775.1 hypothetical protein GCM10010185_45630 [Saccharothrix coeruleofusca]
MEGIAVLSSDREYLGFRTIAILPLLLFLPPLVSFFVDPGARWAEYPGVLFHLAILFLISRMDAPMWAKAAGFGWITLDVLAGALLINEVPAELPDQIRLGGHILAGLWIATASLVHRVAVVRIVGAITGTWLGGYTFVAHSLPEPYLRPAAILLIVWLILLATTHRPATAVPERAGAATAPSA